MTSHVREAVRLFVDKSVTAGECSLSATRRMRVGVGDVVVIMMALMACMIRKGGVENTALEKKRNGN